MLDRELQPEKAKSPIAVTLSGMTMLDRELQSEKAESPIAVTLSGMAILDKLQPANALLHIILVPSLTE